MNWLERHTPARPGRSSPALLALLLCVLALTGSPAGAATTYGTIDVPCGSLAVARHGPQGFCGYRIEASLLTPGSPFTLTPGKPADLDIYFDIPGGTSYVAGCGTGVLQGIVPAGATQAIVVLSPGTVTVACSQQVTVAWTTDVPFSFVQ